MSDFELHQWEIWHTYTTYLDCPGLDVLTAASKLVESEVSECAVSSTGRTVWRSGKQIAEGVTRVDVNLLTGASQYSLVLDDASMEHPTGFALEAWGQSAQFLIGEIRVLGEEHSFTDEYIRAHLGKVVVTVEEGDGQKSEIHLYPVLVIYQSGVLILELRLIGPTVPTTLCDFIQYDLSLPRLKLATTHLNPGLARNATAAYYRSTKASFLRRCRYAISQSLHNTAIEQLTTIVQDQAFSFDLSPWSGENDSLRSIALSIFHTCSYLVTGPRVGLAFLLFGSKVPPSLGAFWSGRPHVHLIRFQNQQETAAENKLIHADCLSSIINKTIGLNSTLPRDSRLFEDYSVFIAETASLCVWSARGLKQESNREDLNRGNFIYERQFIMELLEYGYMLHRGLYHRVESLHSTEQVMSARRFVLQLRLRMREVSHSLEIRDLLEAGWSAFGLPTLIGDIEAALVLREAERRSVDTRRVTRVGWAIAIVFGMVAVPALADQVVIPAWHVIKAWHLLHIQPFANPDKVKLLADSVATVGILALLALVLWMLSLRDRRL